ncbi:MAG: hypothetical protein PVG25_10885 [Anaerolineae bacterium]|jgi:hypothetical protein
MDFLTYPLLVAGLGVLILLFVRNLRLALQLVWTLAKLFIIAFLILLIGSFLGLWRLPPLFAQLYLGLRRLLEPLGRLVFEWIRGWLP